MSFANLSSFPRYVSSIRPMLLAASLATLGAPALAQAETPPSVPYWHLFTGQDGKSHLSKCMMTGFQQQAVNKQWQRKEPADSKILFAYNPKGDWHENPKVQWVVPMQGAFYLKAQDGTEATLAPGELLLGEDLATTPDAQGQKGHVSASKGKDPVVLMLVQLDVKATVGQPCHAQ